MAGESNNVEHAASSKSAPTNHGGRIMGNRKYAGLLLQSSTGKSVQAFLLDSNGDTLDLVANPRSGEYTYEGANSRVTLFLAKPGDERQGPLLQSAKGDPVKAVLRDVNGGYLDLVENPEKGKFEYEGRNSRITLILVERDV